MITDTVTPDGQVTPPGIPCGQVEQSVALPSAKLTNWISSLLATPWLPSQSPAQRAGAGVFVGPGVDERGVSVGVTQIPLRHLVGVGELGVLVDVGVGVSVGVGVGANGSATATPRRPSSRSKRKTIWPCS